MSTLKRIPEAVILGISITVSAIIGIAILLGKITISESWFSLRTLQISLGSGLFALLFMYVQWDKKNLSPNDLKYLVVRSKVTTFLLLGVFLWTILSQPTIPVTVSFKGVAKTADVISTKRDVQKTNENVTQVGATVSSFKEKQEKKNDDFLKQLFDLQNKVVELDKDERVRQEAASDQVASVANDLKKVSVGVEDVKNIDHTNPVVTSASNVVLSEKIRVFGILIILFLMVISVILSFSTKVSSKIRVSMTRKVVPLGLFVIGSILYLYPLFIKTMPSVSDKKIVAKNVVEKKEVPMTVDTSQVKKDLEIETGLPRDSTQQEKPMKVLNKPAGLKERRKRNPVQNDDGKPMRVIQ